MVVKAHDLIVKRVKALEWQKLFHMFYIEPILFVFLFSHSLSGTIMRNQVIYQACTTVFQYNATDCKQMELSNNSDNINKMETEIQPYVANLFMMRTLLESIVPAICGIFVGSWSDTYGRKPLMVISMIGFSATFIIAAVICELSYHFPVNPWYYMLVAVPHSLLGGNCVFTVAAFCFLSDVTDTEARPYRMIILEFFVFVGLMSGSILSSFLYAAMSATIIFSISAILMCGITLFIIICLPESLHLNKNKEETIETEVKSSDLQTGFDEMIVTSGLEANGTEKVEANGKEDVRCTEEKDKDSAKSEQSKPENAQKSASLFSYVHIKDMLVTAFKPRPYYDRSIIWLVTGTMFIAIFIMDGVMPIFYLFVREKFHWTVRDFTFFEAVSHVIPMCGAVVGVVILRKVFKLSLVTLALLAFFSDIVSNLVRGFASQSWHLYLSVAVGAFKSVGGPMCNTIVSNIVPATDLGKIFSIKNILQSLAPFVAAPLYTYIYNQSLRTFPGLFNILSAFLYGIAFVLIAIILRYWRTCKEHYDPILK